MFVENIKSISTYQSISTYIQHEKAFLRMQNIESDYFRNLAHQERNLIKSLLYKYDSVNYQRLESRKSLLDQFDQILFISQTGALDARYALLNHKTVLLPCIEDQSDKSGQSFEQRHPTILYVGNLELADNRESVLKHYQDPSECAVSWNSSSLL